DAPNARHAPWRPLDPKTAADTAVRTNTFPQDGQGGSSAGCAGAHPGRWTAPVSKECRKLIHALWRVMGWTESARSAGIPAAPLRLGEMDPGRATHMPRSSGASVCRLTPGFNGVFAIFPALRARWRPPLLLRICATLSALRGRDQYFSILN